MDLIIGQHGFFNWWAALMPAKIVDGGRNIMNLVADAFAVKAMATHINEPIFQDPTWQGRLIGIGIRIIRIICGLFAQFLVLLATGFAVLLWYVFPILALWGIIK